MHPSGKLGSLGLVLASSAIINCGYVATDLYGVPEVASMILIPCAVVLSLGWFLRDMKRTVVLGLVVVLLSASLMQLSLTTPALFGIFENLYYMRLFIYTAFLKVMRYTVATTIFVLVAALVAGLAFE